METLVTLLLMAIGANCMDPLKIVYEWNLVDFAYPTEEERIQALVSLEFIPVNNLPLGLEVYNDRLFLTLPRWKSGIPASLVYINLTEPSKSPKLTPYPNWSAHDLSSNDSTKIVSPFRIKADRCGRLWVLDTGIEGLLEDWKADSPPKLLIYDLETDELLRTYKIPKEQLSKDSFFANLAVEDHDCNDTYAYLADLATPALVVYSWQNEDSWRIMHNFFHMDPLSGAFNLSGILFEWADGILGLALSRADADGFSTLYFHPLSSTDEFAVSTKFLRNSSMAKQHYHEFKHLGSRGTKGQSGASFLDQKTDVLFYSLVHLNAVACWRTTNVNYTMESQGRVFMSNVTMIFPNDIKIDNHDNLWVLSDRLPTYMYGSLDKNDINFRVFNATVRETIRGTACDSKLVIPRAPFKSSASIIIPELMMAVVLVAMFL